MYTNFSFPLEYNIHPTLLPYPFTKKVLFTIIFKLMYCDVLEYVGIAAPLHNLQQKTL